MPNRYANLTPSKKISDDFQNINTGFDRVQADIDAANSRLDDQDERIDNIVASAGDSNTEIVDARYSSLYNITYPVLTKRIDAIEKDGFDLGVSVIRKGADRTGTAGSADAILTALYVSDTAFVPPGVYLIEKNITIPAGKVLCFAHNARLLPMNGVTITVNGTIKADLRDWVFDYSLGGSASALVSQTYVVSPQWFGAKADGVSDDAASMLNAVTFIDYGDIYFPSGTFRLETDLIVTKPNLRLVGDGAIIKSINATAGRFTIKGCKEVSGFTFDRVTIYIPYDYDNGFLRIQYNTFKGTGLSIYFGTGFSRWAQNVHVLWNVFDGHSYAVYGALTNGRIAFNRMVNSISRNIELSAGDDTVIFGNQIDGGITGISYLCSRNLTGGKGAHNVVIAKNTISNITEEAIGCDLRGNETGKTGSVKRGTISAYYRDIPGRQIIPDFTFTAYQYLHYYIVMLTGKSAGKIYEIDYMGKTGTELLQLSEASTSTTNPDVNIGDQIVIQVPYMGFIITENVVHNSTTGVSLWGNAFQCNIARNRIRKVTNAAIAVNSLFGMIDGDVGACFHNRIENNEINSGSIQISAKTYNATTSPIINSFGNIVKGNRVQHGIITYNYQSEFLVEDNICDDIQVSGIGTSLPIASAKYAGIRRMVYGGSGTADQTFVCLKDASGTYSWKLVKSG